ncbi:unnamed protein product [Rotaria socialis]|uniref:Uncharacterized protein n=1 Tax=Rotaria socialis TaxID=392032 RepID=A0A821KE46_9BILA|nr:unnamed protein product [Rotaria socialis]
MNRIIAVNLRQNRFDPIALSDHSEQNKSAAVRFSLIQARHTLYLNYLKDSITNKINLKDLLTNKYQILYLSIDCVLSEFHDQGLYAWFRSLAMKHIQSRYHFQRTYGIRFSSVSTHVHQKNGYQCIGKIRAKMFE